MTAYWTKDEHATEYDEWVNDLLCNAPESYDDDVAAEEIVVRYVRDLEDETERDRLLRQRIAEEIEGLVVEAQQRVAPWRAIPSSSQDYDTAQRRIAETERFVAVVHRCSEVARGDA